MAPSSNYNQRPLPSPHYEKANENSKYPDIPRDIDFYLDASVPPVKDKEHFAGTEITDNESYETSPKPLDEENDLAYEVLQPVNQGTSNGPKVHDDEMEAGNSPGHQDDTSSDYEDLEPIYDEINETSSGGSC